MESFLTGNILLRRSSLPHICLPLSLINPQPLCPGISMWILQPSFQKPHELCAGLEIYLCTRVPSSLLMCSLVLTPPHTQDPCILNFSRHSPPAHQDTVLSLVSPAPSLHLAQDQAHEKSPGLLQLPRCELPGPYMFHLNCAPILPRSSLKLKATTD